MCPHSNMLQCIIVFCLWSIELHFSIAVAHELRAFTPVKKKKQFTVATTPPFLKAS